MKWRDVRFEKPTKSDADEDDPYLGALPNFRGGEIIRHEVLDHNPDERIV